MSFKRIDIKVTLGGQMIKNGCYEFSSVYMCTLGMCLSGFVWAITCTFVHGFQNNLAQLLSSWIRSVF